MTTAEQKRPACPRVYGVFPQNGLLFPQNGLRHLRNSCGPESCSRTSRTHGTTFGGELPGRRAAADIHPRKTEEHVDRDLALRGVRWQDQHARMIADGR